MNNDTRNLLLLIVFVVLPVSGALWYSNSDYKRTHKILPYYKVEVGSDEFKSSNMPPEKQVSNFNFVNQKGEKVTQESLGDCIYVADYIFTTCPGICKIMTKQMGKVYTTFKDEPHFKILSHTSKPEEDSIPVLLRYSLEQGADDANKWMFLTGNKFELQRMAYQEYGIVNPGDLQAEGSFVHTEMLVLVDSYRYIRGYYDGTDSVEVEKMMLDIRSLLNEQY